jgi:hypothetical protein
VSGCLRRLVTVAPATAIVATRAVVGPTAAVAAVVAVLRPVDGSHGHQDHRRLRDSHVLERNDTAVGVPSAAWCVAARTFTIHAGTFVVVATMIVPVIVVVTATITTTGFSCRCEGAANKCEEEYGCFQ